MEKIVIIVQARLGSSRLPRKVLHKVVGKPLLGLLIEQIQRSQQAHEKIIATTLSSADDAIEVLCKEEGIVCFRGSEEDVLSRFYEAAKSVNADIIVRITADCPLIDPKVIDDVILGYLKQEGKIGYVSNTMERTYPRGMDVEVFSFEMLEQAHQTSDDPYEREHVTPGIQKRCGEENIVQVLYKEDYSDFRWTVDTEEDLKLIHKLLEEVYPNYPEFTLEHLINAYKAHPEWHEINRHIRQKHT